MNVSVTRRELLASGGLVLSEAVAASCRPAPVVPGKVVRTESDIPGGMPFVAGPPCLQAPAETSMGISWSVSDLAMGVVEYADNPSFAAAKRTGGVGSGIVPLDGCAVQVRLTGLKPSTRYWYRTLTTPFVLKGLLSEAEEGKTVVSNVHTFMTMGRDAPARFCAISDTHARWPAFERTVEKILKCAPSAVVWNGDATNTTNDKATAAEIFLSPRIADPGWSTDIPVLFTCGNHDYRGTWAPQLESVMMPRAPSERRGDEWAFKWNFATRLGDMALIGLDTGEDKPDAHPKWFGRALFEPYRRAQADWLQRQLRRDEIAAAPFKVVFCHIPLFAPADSEDYPHDGVKIDPEDYAYWSRECAGLWSPILDAAGVRLVVCGHRHRFRYDPPSPGRRWAQVVGGGPEFGVHRGRADPEKFPTVIEGLVDSGRLRVLVHDVFNRRVVLDTLV